MIKTSFRHSLLGLCLFGLTACSYSFDKNTKAEDEQASIYPAATIGVTISSIETNPFFQNSYKAFETLSKEQSAITLLLDAANDNQQLQLKQLEDMKNKGAKAFVINLVDVNQGGAVIDKYCQEMVLVFFNRNPGEKNLAKCDNAYFVDGDAVQAGLLQGLSVLEKWEANPQWDKNKDGKIQYAILKGIPNHAGSEARTTWVASTMQNYPSLGVPTERIFSDFAMFKTDMAKDTVNQWSNEPDFGRVEVIVANNDSMALGAAEALQAKNINLPIFGIDATADAREAIKNNKMTSTVVNDYQSQVETATRLAANLVAGQPPLLGIGYQMEHKTIRVPYQTLETNLQ